MGVWESPEFEKFCNTCKKITDHKTMNDDEGTETFCLECEV